MNASSAPRAHIGAYAVTALFFLINALPELGAITTFSVRDEPVEQILPAFAEQAGVSIVTDPTVSGPVSIVLHDTDPREAIFQIARAADLLVEDRDGVLWISRVQIHAAGGNTWTVRATGAPLDSVLRAFARASRLIINITSNLRDPVDIELGPLSAREMLPALCEPSGAVVREHRSGFSVDVVDPVGPERTATSRSLELWREKGVLRLSAEHTTTNAVLERLFQDRRAHYTALAPLNTAVRALRLSAPDWNTLWRRVIAALDLHAVLDGSEWIVAPPGQERRLRAFRSRAVVVPVSRTVAEVSEMLARVPLLEIEASDEVRNLLVLRALPRTLEKALELVRILESHPGGNRTVSLPFVQATPSDALEALRHRFPAATFAAEDRFGEIIVSAPRERIAAIRDAAELLDRPRAMHLYLTRYATPDLLIDAAGSDHRLDRLVAGSDGRSIYMQGNAQRVQQVTNFFSSLDRPREQLRFDVCIIQHQESSSRHRGVRASASRESSSVRVFETTWDASAQFDQLLALQFDLISALGYQAAFAVSGELSANAARLIVDTSLHARDGDTAKLENASTYRYRDYREGESSESALGVTREIDSGLTVELTGRLHRDRSVTVKILVSLSKQGADLSGRGNPPPTSRKAVETTVRVKAGEPIVIGGLLQQEETGTSRRLPVIGRIPILRRIVENESKTREETEMVLYLSVFPGQPERSAEQRARQIRRLERMLRDAE